ncbi:hypothetical protein [Sphingosinicella terrae]|uniref:hypothetical protein n=1 Tax=Sphingosinicella terrae TaxID=2172047 RepID=UPI000E0D4F65|nr:hypothetical protein [Sphingosinicella terrae]
MIDVPLPPVQECVSHASSEISRVKVVLTVSGDAVQVSAFVTEQLRNSIWTVEADAQANGIRFLRLVASGDVPYREIGLRLYEVQRRRLEVSYSTIPPICEPEER